jgi:type II secretory pathway pseudopilin PulG
MNFGQKKRWFTLVEMLIVIVIIWVLAAALIPRLTSVRWRANDVARKADLQQVATAIVSYSMDKSTYPPLLWSATSWAISLISTALQKYVTVMPKDPSPDTTLFTEYNNVWDYAYGIITKWWTANAWFFLMAKVETEWWANRVYQWQTWLITSLSDSQKIIPCTTITETWTIPTILSWVCTYSNENQLRYIIAR